VEYAPGVGVGGFDDERHVPSLGHTHVKLLVPAHHVFV